VESVRDLYRGINEYKRGNILEVTVMDENGFLSTDSGSILSKWKNYFS
jgi:hypothetical protein